MNSITHNRYLDALLKLVLFSAIFHMMLLIIYSLLHADGSLLNYFSIVDITLYIPSIPHEGLMNLSSLATVIGLYILIYFFLTHKNPDKKFDNPIE